MNSSNRQKCLTLNSLNEFCRSKIVECIGSTIPEDIFNDIHDELKYRVLDDVTTIIQDSIVADIDRYVCANLPNAVLEKLLLSESLPSSSSSNNTNDSDNKVYDSLIEDASSAVADAMQNAMTFRRQPRHIRWDEDSEEEDSDSEYSMF